MASEVPKAICKARAGKAAPRGAVLQHLPWAAGRRAAEFCLSGTQGDKPSHLRGRVSVGTLVLHDLQLVRTQGRLHSPSLPHLFLSVHLQD